MYAEKEPLLRPGRGPSAPPQRAPPGGSFQCLAPRSTPKHFATSLGNKVAGLQNRAYMADSKNLNGASPNSDTRLTNLSVAEHKKIEDDKKKMGEEMQRQQDQVLKVAKKWYLSHFTVDRH